MWRGVTNEVARLTCLLIALALPGLACAPFPAGHRSMVQVGDLRLRRMAALYQEFGLPVPPRNAELIRIETQGGDITLGLLVHGAQPTIYHGIDGLSETQLQGIPNLHKKTYEHVGEESPAVGQAVPFRIMVEPFVWSRPFEHNNLLETAIQLAIIGREHLALELLKNCFPLYWGVGHLYGFPYQPPDASPERAVACIVMAKALNEWATAGTDRARILDSVRKVESAGLYQGTAQDIEFLRSYRERMEAALEPGKGPARATEIRLNDLLQATGPTPLGMTYMPDWPFKSLILQGFAGIPDMIAHLNDRRLTRMVYKGFNNTPPRLMTIGDVVRDALFLFVTKDTHMNEGWIRDKEITDWWAKTKYMTEEQYCRENLIPPPKKSDPSGSLSTEVWPNEALLAICEVRYPKLIRQAYAKARGARPDVVLVSLRTALKKSSLEGEPGTKYGSFWPELFRKHPCAYVVSKDHGLRVVTFLDKTGIVIATTTEPEHFREILFSPSRKYAAVVAGDFIGPLKVWVYDAHGPVMSKEMPADTQNVLWAGGDTLLTYGKRVPITPIFGFEGKRDESQRSNLRIDDLAYVGFDAEHAFLATLEEKTNPKLKPPGLRIPSRQLLWLNSALQKRERLKIDLRAPMALRVSQKGKLVALADGLDTVYLVDPRTQETLKVCSTGDVDYCWSPESEELLSFCGSSGDFQISTISKSVIHQRKISFPGIQIGRGAWISKTLICAIGADRSGQDMVMVVDVQNKSSWKRIKDIHHPIYIRTIYY